MTRSASPKLGRYAAFAGVAFLLAFVLGQPELAALGAPFAVYLLLALALSRPFDQRVAFELDRERAVEGDIVQAEVEVDAARGAPDLELHLLLPDGVAVASEQDRGQFRFADGETTVVPLQLAAEHWGVYQLGDVVVRARDRFGLFSFDGRLSPAVPLRVYPGEERLRSLVRPLELQPFAGNHVARTSGDGIEFADTRPFVPGDRVHRINWRLSARRQTLYVTEAQPERNTDVVLFLDSFAEVRREQAGTLDLAVRAAASLTRAYLDQRDRVGIVGFGAVLRWLTPSMGRRQLYQIVDALLETEVALSYAWKDVDVLPPRSLPPQALVIALSPLLDDRSVRALFDLRTRGFDLVIVDVSPLPFTAAEGSELDTLAFRLWRLWREALRYRYERLGVPVVEWGEERSLLEAVEEVRAFRRHARRARA